MQSVAIPNSYLVSSLNVAPPTPPKQPVASTGQHLPPAAPLPASSAGPVASADAPSEQFAPNTLTSLLQVQQRADSPPAAGATRPVLDGNPPPAAVADAQPTPAATASPHVTVSDLSGLEAALKTAQPGDTIQLAAGNYGDATIRGVTFASDVTLTSAAGASPAVFHSLKIASSSHLNLVGIDVEMTPTAATHDNTAAVSVQNSSDITFSGGRVTGGAAVNGVAMDALKLDATGNVLGLPTGVGFDISGSTGVSIENLDISHFDRGMKLNASDHVLISQNDIHDLRRTAIVGGSLSQLTIDGNHIHDETPWRWGQTPVGDHADFLALWTNPKTQSGPSADITVSNNLMEQGQGTAVLGMWLQGQPGQPGQPGQLGFTNVTIENNTFLNGNFQGITLTGVDGAKVDGNTLLQTSGNAKAAPGILLTAGARNIQVSGNMVGSVHDRSGATGTDVNTIDHNTLVQRHDPAGPGFYGEALVAQAAAGFAKTNADRAALAGAGDALPSTEPEVLSPFAAQAARNAALKSGDKTLIAKATADEDAAFAKWRLDHAAAAAVTPESKALYEARLGLVGPPAPAITT